MKLGFLRPLYSYFGGYVSVYLDVSQAAEDAARAIEWRWRSAREQLAADGADQPTLDAVREVVTGTGTDTDPVESAAGLAVFARHGTVALSAPLRAAPRRDIARFGALPHVMPLLAQRPPRIPHLRVAARPAGGEILAVAGTGRILDQWRVRGRWPLHELSVGRTLSQYGPHAEWEANAREISARMATAAAEVHAEHIILAGDPRVRPAVLDYLNPKLRAITAVVDAEVPADSSALAEAAEKITTQISERTSDSRFGTWHSRMAEGTAVAGLASTVQALAGGRAAHVFLAGDPPPAPAWTAPAWTAPGWTAPAWTGPSWPELALTADTLTGRDVTSPLRDRVDAAIARAVACTDADLFFLPDDAEPPQDGIGATLRY